VQISKCQGDRLLELINVFAFDIAAHAVMSNHSHVVLHVDTERVLAWSEFEVAESWHRLFNGSLLRLRYARGEEFTSSKVKMREGCVIVF